MWTSWGNASKAQILKIPLYTLRYMHKPLYIWKYAVDSSNNINLKSDFFSVQEGRPGGLSKFGCNYLTILYRMLGSWSPSKSLCNLYKVSVVFEVYLYMFFPSDILHLLFDRIWTCAVGEDCWFFPDESDMLNLITVPCPQGARAGLNKIRDGWEIPCQHGIF